jgi:hypothetical protein
LSLRPSFTLFRQMLDIVEERRKSSASAVFTFLKTVQNNPFPSYGKDLEVRTFGVGAAGKGAASGEASVYHLSRGSETGFPYLDYVSYSTLMKCLNSRQLAELFGMLLLERRMIVVSKSLSVLSSCISAISHLAFPLLWQHVYIPVLPPSLIDYCTAPMPFLVGMLASSLDLLRGMPIDEVTVIDLDKGSYLKNPTYDVQMPEARLLVLQKRLEPLAKAKHTTDQNVAQCLLDSVRELLGGYKEFVQGASFRAVDFIATFPVDERQFFSEVQNSQLWNCFLEERRRASPGSRCPSAVIGDGVDVDVLVIGGSTGVRFVFAIIIVVVVVVVVDSSDEVRVVP